MRLTLRLPVLRRAPWLGRTVLAAAGLVCAGLAQAQVNCAGLQAQIAALARQPSTQATSYNRAAQKQQAELAKTANYANALGCNRQRFLFFGDPPPPQCGALNQRIAAMQANLGRLQSAARVAGNEEQRRMLTAQYDTYCRQQVASARPGNFFEQLFGGGPRMMDVPVNPETPEQPTDDLEEQGPRRGSMAVCVRKCDGGFFPVSYSASRSNLDELADLCTALCPNADTILFTKRPDAEIEYAISADGDSYESLANAGKFKKRFDPSCTCKPANRSWVEALAEAEKLLSNKDRRDLIVTPQKAEELSRPKLTPATAPAPRGAKPSPAQPAAVQPSAAEVREKEALAVMEREGREEAEAASRSNAGITPGRHTAGRLFTVRDGQRATVTLPDGETRTIRVIGPKT